MPQPIQLIGHLSEFLESDPAAAGFHHGEWAASVVDPQITAAAIVSMGAAEAEEMTLRLLGDQVDNVKGHGRQYHGANAQSRRVFAYFEMCQEGGWWCSGLDPQHDFRCSMEWGCFKPDSPRATYSEDGKHKPIKYEHPVGVPTRTFWLPTPAHIAARIARRQGLTPPPDVTADDAGIDGALWRWLRRERTMECWMTEGAKKAGSLLTAGAPCIGLPGIWSGAPCPSDMKGFDGRNHGRPELHPDLQGPWIKGRAFRILFDHSDKPKGNEDTLKAAARQARQLMKHGAARVAYGLCPGPEKGVDDWLAAGKTLDELVKAVDWKVLAKEGPEAEEGAWRIAPLRPADVTVPAGQFLGASVAIPSPDQARLVAIAAPMGAGKTQLIRSHLADGLSAGTTKVLGISHRRSLAEAFAQQLGLPTGQAAAPCSPLRNLGICLCIDSLCPQSGAQIDPEEFRGKIVCLDEVVGIIHHALLADTTVRGRRVSVLQTLAAILRVAGQVIISDALLTPEVLELIENIMGCRAHLIVSEHRPAAGRSAYVINEQKAWLAELMQQVRAGRKVFVATTAQQVDSSYAAVNIAQLIREVQPDWKVLLIDSETTSEGGDAAAFSSDPTGVAALYDAIVASPSITSGVSVETIADARPFDALFLRSGGTLPPEDVVQIVGRVRGDCPRFLCLPRIPRGAALRMGSGSMDPDEVLTQLDRHEKILMRQLNEAGCSISAGETGHWLPYWCLLASHRNRQRHNYRGAILAMLQREGYAICRTLPSALGDADAARLDAISVEALEAEDAAIIAAPALTHGEAEKIRGKRRRSREENIALRRHRVDQEWCLAGEAPSPDVMRAHRAREARALRRRLFIERRELVAVHDRQMATAASAGQMPWDLCRDSIGPVVAAADAIGLSTLISRAGDCSQPWMAPDDPALIRIHSTVTMFADGLTQVLGLRPCKTATGTVRALLAHFGCRLEVERVQVDGQKSRRYRVMPSDLPEGISWQQLADGWAEQVHEGMAAAS